jgi:hypothetical protein
MPAPKATALVFRDNKVLLVRVDWKPYALPAMNIRDPRDPAIAVACRQLSIVLNLDSEGAERLRDCDVISGRYSHRVVRVDVDPCDHPVVMSGITEFIWWDRVTPISRHDHVDNILEKYDQTDKDSNT